MNILAIESSGESCSVALLLANGEVAGKSASVPRKHAELILPMIRDLMQEQNILPEQIGFIAFGEGPGNFTGTRLSASITQGLAFGWNKPVLPVPTLTSMAVAAFEQCQQTEQQDKYNKIMVAMDARKQEVSFAAFKITGEIAGELAGDLTSEMARLNKRFNLIEIKSAEILSPSKIDVLEGDDWLAVGTAWGKYPVELTQKFLDTNTRSLAKIESDFLPGAGMVAKLAAKLYQDDPCCLLAAEKALPKYFRDSV